MRSILNTVIHPNDLQQRLQSATPAVQDLATKAKIYGLSSVVIERPGGQSWTVPGDHFQTKENGILEVLSSDGFVLASVAPGGWVSAKLIRPEGPPKWSTL